MYDQSRSLERPDAAMTVAAKMITTFDSRILYTEQVEITVAFSLAELLHFLTSSSHSKRRVKNSRRCVKGARITPPNFR